MGPLITGCAGCQVARHYSSFLWSSPRLCGEERDGQQSVSSPRIISSAALLDVLGSRRCAVKEAPFPFVTCDPKVIAYACLCCASNCRDRKACAVPLTVEVERQPREEIGGRSLWTPLSLFLNL